MKALLTLAALTPSLALAVDFDLRPLDKGGNADMVSLSQRKVRENPKAFIGKSVRIPLEDHCGVDDVVSTGADGKKQNFDVATCMVNAEFIEIIGDLRLRDALTQSKMREIVGSIVGVSEHGRIVVKPTEIITK